MGGPLLFNLINEVLRARKLNAGARVHNAMAAAIYCSELIQCWKLARSASLAQVSVHRRMWRGEEGGEGGELNLQYI